MHVGIVDDDLRLIENLRFLLQSEPGVQSVHTFASAEAFLAAQPRPELDILLVDMDLPGLSGVELIARSHHLQCNGYSPGRWPPASPTLSTFIVLASIAGAVVVTLLQRSPMKARVPTSK